MMLEFGTDNAEINESCKLPPFVLSMQDTSDNELIITIALPQIANNNVKTELISECNNPRLKEIISDAQPVHEDMERIYEIRFERYILYQCRNESYADSDPSEIIRGKHLVILEKSMLLEYYQKVIADFDYDTEKANRKHYGIYAANHTIDVISNEPPVITRVYSSPAHQAQEIIRQIKQKYGEACQFCSPLDEKHYASAQDSLPEVLFELLKTSNGIFELMPDPQTGESMPIYYILYDLDNIQHYTDFYQSEYGGNDTVFAGNGAGGYLLLRSDGKVYFREYPDEEEELYADSLLDFYQRSNL